MRKNLIFYYSFLFMIIAFSVFVNSCKNDNEEDLITLKDSVICNTANVTYTSIKSIFDNNCVRCHNDQINNNGILLNTYEHARSAAQTGILKKAVNHSAGATPMPYQLPKLGDCDVRKITIWIEINTPE